MLDGGKLSMIENTSSRAENYRWFSATQRTGNALGTLAFTWATVVLLGGYPTVLRQEDDFYYATTIIFVEGTRMFSRNNRLDYQLFFRTRGAFRPAAGWNGLIVVACISNIMLCTIFWGQILILMSPFTYVLVILLLAIVQFLCSAASRLLTCNPIRRAISLWSPMVAILLLGPFALGLYLDPDSFIPKKKMARWIIAYLVLLVVVLLLTISRFRFPSIIKLQCATPFGRALNGTLGSKQEFWCQVALKLCIIASIIMPVLFMTDSTDRNVVLILEALALVLVSFGNLQIPAATVRIALALLRLIPHYYYGEGEYIDENNLKEKTNLVASLDIFYGMVLVQGILYITACIFEVFSFIPRRSLIRHGGFGGQWGVASVNLYYSYAFEKYMEGDVLAPKKISLITFAMDNLNSESPKMQLYGVQMLHIFLQREQTRDRLIGKLTTSTKTMARLISMLGWTSSSHTIVRLYAAKATVELAKILQVVIIPGTLQLVSSLLDIEGKQKMRNPLLEVGGDHDGKQAPINNTSESQEERPGAIRDSTDDQCRIQEPLQDTENLLQTETRSTQINSMNSFILRSWQEILEYWSIPKEQPLTEYDLLPALGMSIVNNLASGDQNNLVEIDRVNDLVLKIIGFTSFRSAITNSKAQQTVLVKSSLKVLHRLTSIGGEIGIALRYKISKHPFLLRNLAEILEDNKNNQELSKLVAGILRNLAIDGDTRQEIGHMHVLITRLIKVFLNLDRTSSTNVDCLLPQVAGQALAMLAIDNVHNCLVMLKEPWFTNKLKNMILINDEKYTYVAASLLCSMCQNARAKLTESDLKELCHTLREVLERIMNVEGAELEILISLCSQICKIIPEEFVQELEGGQIKKRFMRRLVDTLNENMNPGAHCPGIRRVIIEQSIYMMECSSDYANCFNELRMMEALSMVEEMPSNAENYRIFLGDAGFMKYNTPIFALVGRAKELMSYQCLQGRLVNALNAHMVVVLTVPASGLRRVIFQNSMYLMEFNSGHANDFHKGTNVGWWKVINRTGNALGTLAFTWATVVLLGGYPTVLRSQDDFIYATTIIFLEAARMFSRNNRLDYQLFFRTRGAFRPATGRNGLIVAAYISNALISVSLGGPPWFTMVVIPLAIGHFLYSAASRLVMCNLIRRAISLWSPIVAVLSSGPFVLELYIDPGPRAGIFIPKKSIARLMIAYLVLVVIWRRVTLNLCIIASIMIPVLIIEPAGRYIVIILEAIALVLVTFGNLQIPAATVRVVLALLCLIPHNYYSDNEQIDKNELGEKTNLPASLNIFYGMVLGQGILYIAACIFEFFSFIPRRFLIRRGGFGGEWGVASVNLYYAYAFEKYMEGGVLAPKKISVITFAMDSLNSDSPKMQLYGAQMMHIFLQREWTRDRLIAKLTSSRTGQSHTVLRLYAAKATVELAASLQVVTIPGTVPLVSSLLDTANRHKRVNPLLDPYSDQEGKQDPINNAADNEEGRQGAGDAPDDQCLIQEPLQDTYNLLETQTRSTHINEQNTFIFRIWQQISEYWSIPKEQPLTNHDLLPAVGMSIVDNLAGS
uniref:Saposin B-type domain-containing protein n=1 Tax=Leersia perrieri TaxID=77586 RepID=A0A0D9X2A6_9ORYZ